jgi:hypothetical protein
VENAVVETPIKRCLWAILLPSLPLSLILCRWVQVAVSGDLCSPRMSQPRAELGVIFLDSHPRATFSIFFCRLFASCCISLPPLVLRDSSLRCIPDMPPFRIVALPFGILCHRLITSWFISPRITLLYLAHFGFADERIRYERNELLGLQRAGNLGPPQQLPALIREGMSAPK